MEVEIAKECVTTHLPNQLAPKWMALKRATYTRPSRQVPGPMSRRALRSLRNLGRKPGRSGRWQGKSAKWIRNFGKRIGSEGWARGSQSRTRRLPVDCLSCSRGESGLPRAGRGTDWERLLRGPSPGVEQSTQNCETTAKGTGLAESAGKEDPVELDSSPTL
ncbi:hypothetical protein AgCh_010777 [Apium graveolens]